MVKRISSKVRGKEEILESLARFSLTNSQIETNVLLPVFAAASTHLSLRIINLGTIADHWRNLGFSDAIYEYALRIAVRNSITAAARRLKLMKGTRQTNSNSVSQLLANSARKRTQLRFWYDLLFFFIQMTGSTSGQGGTVQTVNISSSSADSENSSASNRWRRGISRWICAPATKQARGALRNFLERSCRLLPKSARRRWGGDFLIQRTCAGDRKSFAPFQNWSKCFQSNRKCFRKRSFIEREN